MGFKINRMSG